MEEIELNDLTSNQKINIINIFGSIILKSDTPKQSVDNLINMIKNEAELLKLPHIIKSLMDNGLLAKDSQYE